MRNRVFIVCEHLTMAFSTLGLTGAWAAAPGAGDPCKYLVFEFITRRFSWLLVLYIAYLTSK